MYKTKQYQEFEKAELLLYEEVVRSPPFQRKTLVLIGAPGVGRRTLKNRLLSHAPERFETIIPYTSRPPKDGEESGKNYHFSTRSTMELEIAEHHYLEYGEAGGHLYGTKLDTIRHVMRQGKMCILDCSPQAVKILHNSSEFMPFVVFIAAPGVEQLRFMAEYGKVMGQQSHMMRSQTFDRALRYSSRRARTMESLASVFTDEDLRRTMEESARLQRAYDKYIDLVLVNEDFDLTFRRLLDAIEGLSTESQWIPVQWIY
ncbi:unnamed protein product [Cyprideis torosa]|uniref:Uncharacterized protein n=1 Tax=Cyprideis torosa TaxID=163714 RepID=A0A7R8WQD0_9CRUS|nr:unnamed protein product [Cyprideis torosa]CAG0902560.1 unnamed protein product [Cyprideis torosa]